MSKTALVAALALAAAACSKSTPGEKSTSPEKPAPTKPATATGNTAKGYNPLSGRGGTVDQRLDWIEKRVDAITDILVKALPPKEADPDKVYSVAIDPTDPVEGPADAPVTIVEGFEFLCPYCWKASSTVEKIQKDYPEGGPDCRQVLPDPRPAGDPARPGRVRRQQAGQVHPDEEPAVEQDLQRAGPAPARPDQPRTT